MLALFSLRRLVSLHPNIICLFLLSSSPSSSSQVKFHELRFPHKILPLFDCVLARGRFTEHDAAGVIRLRCRLIPPSPRNRPPRSQVRFPLSFDRRGIPKNILYCFKDPHSDIVIVDIGMHVPVQFSPSLLILYSAKRLHLPDERG